MVALKFRLYPTPAQQQGMLTHCGHARFLYNVCVEQANLWRPGLSSPNSAERMRQLTEARKAFEWLAAGSTIVQQGALRDFDRAQRNWWSNPGHYRRPTFKRRGVSDGFVIRDLTVTKINRKWATVTVPKVGPVRFRLTRAFADVKAGTSARVTHRGGRWHISITAPARTFERTQTGAMVGIDRGVINTLALSDGTFDHIPTLTEPETARMTRLQRRLARQQKGSNRRRATRGQIARLHQKGRDRRTDWIEQTTTRLVRDHDLIAIEKLTTANMVRRPAPKPDPETPGVWLPNRAAAKAGLNRGIHAACWSQFAKRLHDKADQTPELARTHIIEVPAPNTSRQCRACGHIAAKNRESQATFNCASCGHHAHADTNAAENILARANPTATPQQGPDGYAAGHAVNGRARPTRAASTTQPALAIA